jgi:YebC/PmpR family DNA-binding regulatory protein
MSGHSKWANIKRRKGAQDAARGKVFGKLIREITVAARLGGGDPAGNARLRTVMDKARAANMPNATIERAIKKGSGELGGEGLIEITYEGYGPGGVAVMVACITDNRNRTTSEIRHLFTKYGGNLGQDGCVGWIFTAKGVIQIERGALPEERLMEVALESGAEDVIEEKDYFEIRTAPDDFPKAAAALRAMGVAPTSAEVTKIPTTAVKLTEAEAGKVLKLLDLLQDHDDVQYVYSNFDIPDEVLERLGHE